MDHCRTFLCEEVEDRSDQCGVAAALGEHVERERRIRGGRRPFVIRRGAGSRSRHPLHGGHTRATLALRGGVHPKVVQERLGHSTIGITLNIYPHVSVGMQRDSAEKVAGLIFGT